MSLARYPSLYEISTRIWLGELSRELGRPATFDDVPDRVLDDFAAAGFDWIWFMGAWQTGPVGRNVSSQLPREQFQALLPDFTGQDVAGSPFAVESYVVHSDFGGNEALLRLRMRLRQRGIRLLLDFVGNHTALDHPWTVEHPEYYIQGSEADLAQWPNNYCRLDTSAGPRILAHGRDPYFPGWTDTLQLNYRHAGLRQAMIGQLANIAGLCDGVRCDMAMLLLPEVFTRTWRDHATPADGSAPADQSFWPEAIASIHRRWPDFIFVAEVYWDLELELQHEGFNYTYDKRLYDWLRSQDAGAVRAHLWEDLDFQRKSVRFLENHDEPRAAAVFPPDVHRAAAVLTYLVPGMRFFQEGQLEGRRQRASVRLRRRQPEPVEPSIREFYGRLLECLHRPEVRDGRWQFLECHIAWPGNWTWERFIAFTWQERTPPRAPMALPRTMATANAAQRGPGHGHRLIVAVNYGSCTAQCYVKLPLPELHCRHWLLRDVMGTAEYDRDGTEMSQKGLYLELPAWGYHVFEVVPK
jgi:hypothetical protein